VTPRKIAHPGTAHHCDTSAREIHEAEECEMPDAFIVSRPRPGICRLTFDNRPGNLVDPDMILQLQAQIGAWEADDELRVVIFDSAIDGHFLGPYDLSQAARTPSEIGPTGMPPWLDLTERLSRLPVVSIAVIRGASLGVGNEFALACDLRFASVERALINQPEVGRGFVPGGGAVSRLPGLIGRARALEVVLGSVAIDGPTAQTYGLVNRALPDAGLDGFVDDLAGRIAGFDRRALAETKALINVATLPTHNTQTDAYQAFFASVARTVKA